MHKPLVKPGSADGKKWERLFIKYWKLLYAVAIRRLMNGNDAADVVQTTFEKVSQNLDKIDESDERRTFNYLLSILKNLIADKYRMDKKEQEALTKIQAVKNPSDELTEDVEQQVFTKLRLEDIIKFVRQMDELQTTVFLLYYLNDIPISELSKMTGKTDKQLYEILRGVRNKIKKHIREEEKKP